MGERKREYAHDHERARRLAGDDPELAPFFIPIADYLARADAQRQEEPARPYPRRCERCGVPLECGDRCADCLAGGMG
jgi:hypothetical protein